MAEFRAKSVLRVVEAVQWRGESNCAEVFKFLGWDDHDDTDEMDHTEIHIPVKEGTITAEPGDWVLKPPQGDFFLLKPEVFEETYEATGQ